MAEISLLVRVNAAWLAMADRPFDFVAWALAITLMSSVFTASVWSLAFPSCQKFWSCCQNEGVLPMLATDMDAVFSNVLRRLHSCGEAVNLECRICTDLRSVN